MLKSEWLYISILSELVTFFKEYRISLFLTLSFLDYNHFV
jgi:hypothetical protein